METDLGGYKLECGCYVSFGQLDMYTGFLEARIRVEFCEKHKDVKTFLGPDGVRFEGRTKVSDVPRVEVKTS